jgi:hypothetical protein
MVYPYGIAMSGRLWMFHIKKLSGYAIWPWHMAMPNPNGNAIWLDVAMSCGFSLLPWAHPSCLYQVRLRGAVDVRKTIYLRYTQCFFEHFRIKAIWEDYSLAIFQLHLVHFSKFHLNCFNQFHIRWRGGVAIKIYIRKKPFNKSLSYSSLPSCFL